MKKTLSLFLRVSVVALGAFPVESEAACRASAVVTGASCADLSVSVQLDGCKSETLSTSQAEVWSCKGNEARASVLSGSHIYRVRLEKKEENFGNFVWKVVGEVQRAPRAGQATKSAPVSATGAAPAAVPAATAATTLPETVKAPQLRFSAFLDAQFQESLSTSVSNGFVLQDGAFYLAHQSSWGEAKIDVPFQMLGAAGNSNIEFGMSRGQAYIIRSLGSDFVVKFGQWDTPYGVELNDTGDNYFGRQGLIYSAGPVVHTGAFLSYTLLPRFTANFLVANPHDTGNAAGEGLETGWQFVLSGPLRASLGGLWTEVKGTSENVRYFDAIVGASYGPVSVDIEAQFQKGKGSSQYDQRYFALAVVNLSPKWSFGARYELAFLGDNALLSPAQIPNTRKKFAVGPQWTLDPASRIRLDYSHDQTDSDDVSIARVKDIGVNLSWVYRIEP